MNASMTLPQSRRHEATVNGTVTHFSRLEHALLSALLIRGSAASSRSCLTEIVWPNPDLEPEWSSRCLYVFIMRIRAKGVRITNCHGVGYVLTQFVSGPDKHINRLFSPALPVQLPKLRPIQLTMQARQVGSALAPSA
jgi:hypothetical protein